MAAKSSAKAPQIVRPIIIKRITQEAHSGHHGGAWKVAYADFVTAMMAFFLLMWLIGATNEKQRKSIADYFAPTLIQNKTQSAGGFGPFGGDSLQKSEKFPFESAQIAMKAPMLMMDVPETQLKEDREKFQTVQMRLAKQMETNKNITKLMKNIRFTETRDGMRIDLVDDANFSMFLSGSDELTPDATILLRQVTQAVRDTNKPILIRGHTDSAQWTKNNGMNNWILSAQRADKTRQYLLLNGIPSTSIARIDGVADSEPYVPEDKFDPRNRRISITLGWGWSKPAK